jgi:hypothetical protein
VKFEIFAVLCAVFGCFCDKAEYKLKKRDRYTSSGMIEAFLSSRNATRNRIPATCFVWGSLLSLVFRSSL